MDYAKIAKEEIQNAPSSITSAYNFVFNYDYQSAINVLELAIREIKSFDRQWIGFIYCCYAFCMKEIKDYEKAIKYAILGKDYELNLLGNWYYYEAIVNSLNYTDNLLDALRMVREAIDYYKNHNYKEAYSDFLARKANILKQLAAPLSRDLKELEQAKKYCIEAIHAICESVNIFKEGWEQLEKELKALSNIAARSGVTKKDISFLDKMVNIKEIVELYFDEITLLRKAVSEYRNMAVDAIKQNNYLIAERWYEKALETAIERDPQDRAFKAYVAYFYGVCLLRMYNLENFDESTKIDTEKQKVIQNIRNIWDMCLQLSGTLSSEEFGSFFAQDQLRSAIRSIISDPLMLDWMKGRELLLNKNYKMAHQYLLKANSIAPDPKILINLATAERYIGSWGKAKEYLESALNYVNEDSMIGLIYYNMGNIFREIKNFQEAVNFYKKSIKHRPEHVGTHFNLALCFMMLEQYDNAIKEFKIVLEIDPNNIEANNNIELCKAAKKMKLKL